MKKIYAGMLMMLTTTFCSCAGLLQSPELYEDEIEDAVKFYIATADYTVETYGGLLEFDMYLGYSNTADLFLESLDEMGDAVDDLYTSYDISYEEALKRMAGNPNNKFAKEAKSILENYRSTSISLSDYEASSTRSDYKSWTFKELHSGITFLFEIENLQSDTPTFSCSPVEASYFNYLEKHFN